MASTSSSKDATNKQQKVFEEVKKNFRAILIAHAQHGRTLNNIKQDYKDSLGMDVPFRKAGFKSLSDLVEAMPDAVSVAPANDGSGQEHLYPVDTEQTSNLTDFVVNQVAGKVSRFNSSLSHADVRKKVCSRLMRIVDTKPVVLDQVESTFKERHGQLEIKGVTFEGCRTLEEVINTYMSDKLIVADTVHGRALGLKSRAIMTPTQPVHNLMLNPNPNINMLPQNHFMPPRQDFLPQQCAHMMPNPPYNMFQWHPMQPPPQMQGVGIMHQQPQPLVPAQPNLANQTSNVSRPEKEGFFDLGGDGFSSFIDYLLIALDKVEGDVTRDVLFNISEADPSLRQIAPKFLTSETCDQIILKLAKRKPEKWRFVLDDNGCTLKAPNPSLLQQIKQQTAQKQPAEQDCDDFVSAKTSLTPSYRSVSLTPSYRSVSLTPSYRSMSLTPSYRSMSLTPSLGSVMSIEEGSSRIENAANIVEVDEFDLELEKEFGTILPETEALLDQMSDELMHELRTLVSRVLWVYYNGVGVYDFPDKFQEIIGFPLEFDRYNLFHSCELIDVLSSDILTTIKSGNNSLDCFIYPTRAVLDIQVPLVEEALCDWHNAMFRALLASPENSLLCWQIIVAVKLLCNGLILDHEDVYLYVFDNRHLVDMTYAKGKLSIHLLNNTRKLCLDRIAQLEAPKAPYRYCEVHIAYQTLPVSTQMLNSEQLPMEDTRRNVKAVLSQYEPPEGETIHFYAALELEQDSLDALMAQLQAFYTSDAAEKYHIPNENVSPNIICCVLYRELGFHRGHVQSIQGNNAKVSFIDYGTCDLVGLDKCYTLVKEFCKLPRQALHCKVARLKVRPDMNQMQVERIEELIFASLDDKPLNLKVRKVEDNGCLQVDVYNWRGQLIDDVIQRHMPGLAIKVDASNEHQSFDSLIDNSVTLEKLRACNPLAPDIESLLCLGDRINEDLNNGVSARKRLVQMDSRLRNLPQIDTYENRPVGRVVPLLQTPASSAFMPQFLPLIK